MRNMHFKALLAGVSLLGVACGNTEPELISEEALKEVTFEQFKETAYDEPDSDVFVVNGDETVVGVEGLREYFNRFVRRELGTHEDALTAYCVNGTWIRWTPAQARNLTYCVSTAFGARYSTVVSAMNSAAAGWEAIANVNFIHLSQYDSACTASQTGVVFDVRPVSSGGAYLARSFFPNAPRSGRNVLIDSSAFGTIAPWTLAGLLRHELGHVLGFRHERLLVAPPGCYEDTTNSCPLTAHDPNSVMRYPQCGDIQAGDLVFSALDREGARIYYP